MLALAQGLRCLMGGGDVSKAPYAADAAAGVPLRLGVALEHSAVSQRDFITARRLGIGIELRDAPQKARPVLQLMEYSLQQVGIATRGGGGGGDPPHFQEALVEAQDPAARVHHEQSICGGIEGRLV